MITHRLYCFLTRPHNIFSEPCATPHFPLLSVVFAFMGPTTKFLRRRVLAFTSEGSLASTGKPGEFSFQRS